jgi:hypothetical protein
MAAAPGGVVALLLVPAGTLDMVKRLVDGVLDRVPGLIEPAGALQGVIAG